MELICRAGVIDIYDDFAHHPTAIQTLGLRARVGQDYCSDRVGFVHHAWG